jgi:DNA-binding transcriptional ArsR family regulator
MSRSSVLEALVEPRRREILRLIRTEELPVGEIARHFDITRGAISQHLGVLKAAGLVSERRDGARRLYRVRLQGFAELQEFLDEFWDTRLLKLTRAAEAAPVKARPRRRGRPVR